MKTNKKDNMKAIKLLILSVCTLALLPACNQKSSTTTTQSSEVKLPKVKLAQVTVEPVAQLQEYSATIEGDVKNNIAPAQPLRIDEIFVEVGDNVSKGQKLVQMDETNLKQLELQIKNMEVEFNRIDQLYKVGGVAQSEWESLKTQVEVSKTSYSNLLSNTVLLSPIDGVVTARNYDKGDNYGGQPILVVQRITPVKLIINVSEKYFSNVSKNDEVTIQLDAYPGETFSGKVKILYPTIDPATHTFPVEVVVPNSDRKLRPGMFARVTLNLGTENRVVVPDVSVVKQSGSGDRYVYVFNNGKVEYKKVELGQRMGDRYELISGVTSSAQVVVAGQSRLTNGASVEVEQ